jgi:hypothetical protein
MSHESARIRSNDYVLHEVTGRITLGDSSGPAPGIDGIADTETKADCLVRLPEDRESVEPVNVEWTDTVHLHHGFVVNDRKHRRARGQESVTTHLECLERSGVKALASSEADCPAQYGQVLIHRVSVRRNHCTGKLPYAHDERLTC